MYRTGSDQAVTTVYDEAGRWIGDYNASGAPLRQAIWLDDLPVGLLVGAGADQTLYYIEADALGTPRVVIDPDRDVAVWRWELSGEAFGASAPNQDADNDGVPFVLDMRFPGQRYDSASGMNYNYFRDYDPSTGRYVQSDPIGLNGGFATYDYAESRPNISIDRLGLSPESGVGVSTTPNSCELCVPDKRRFDNRTEAARTVLAAVYLRSRDKNIEICGQICRDNQTGAFFIGAPTLGTGVSCMPFDKECPACSTSAGWWHTHGAPDGRYPSDAEIFSGEDGDIGLTNRAARITGDPNFTGFLGTPQGLLMSYTANSLVGPINRGPL